MALLKDPCGDNRYVSLKEIEVEIKKGEGALVRAAAKLPKAKNADAVKALAETDKDFEILSKFGSDRYGNLPYSQEADKFLGEHKFWQELRAFLKLVQSTYEGYKKVDHEQAVKVVRDSLKGWVGKQVSTKNYMSISNYGGNLVELEENTNFDNTRNTWLKKGLVGEVVSIHVENANFVHDRCYKDGKITAKLRVFFAISDSAGLMLLISPNSVTQLKP